SCCPLLWTTVAITASFRKRTRNCKADPPDRRGHQRMLLLFLLLLSLLLMIIVTVEEFLCRLFMDHPDRILERFQIRCDLLDTEMQQPSFVIFINVYTICDHFPASEEQILLVVDNIDAAFSPLQAVIYESHLNQLGILGFLVKHDQVSVDGCVKVVYEVKKLVVRHLPLAFSFPRIAHIQELLCHLPLDLVKNNACGLSKYSSQHRL